jgi:DNA-binding NtrC family response regulator
MKEKVPILYIWTDQAEATRVIAQLAETGVNFEAKLVKTQAEYVSALVKARFSLIIADEWAETVGAREDDLSLFKIAEQISPGTQFVLVCDSVEKEAENAERANNFSTISRQDLRQLKNVIDRALCNPDRGEPGAPQTSTAEI